MIGTGATAIQCVPHLGRHVKQLYVTGGFQDEDLVADGWTDIIRNLGSILGIKAQVGGDIAPKEIGRMVELADFKKMNQVRGRVDDLVKDQSTAESLKPGTDSSASDRRSTTSTYRRSIVRT